MVLCEIAQASHAASSQLGIFTSNRGLLRWLALAGGWTPYPDVPALTQKTATGRAAALARRPSRVAPNHVVTVVERKLGQPFAEVAICGGHLYLQVAAAWVDEFKTLGCVRPDAPVRIINASIGYMRTELRTWLSTP